MIELESAVQWITEILNTEVFVYGTSVLTIGHIILLILKWILPNNKIINNQESTIGILEEENQNLKDTNAQLVADVETLKRQMDVVLTYSQNRHYKEARNIETLAEIQQVIQSNITELVKKTKKIKVKKGVE